MSTQSIALNSAITLTASKVTWDIAQHFYGIEANIRRNGRDEYCEAFRKLKELPQMDELGYTESMKSLKTNKVLRAYGKGVALKAVSILTAIAGVYLLLAAMTSAVIDLFE